MNANDEQLETIIHSLPCSLPENMIQSAFTHFYYTSFFFPEVLNDSQIQVQGQRNIHQYMHTKLGRSMNDIARLGIKDQYDILETIPVIG